MKKFKKSNLSLTAETIRNLSDAEAKQAAGGWPSQLTCATQINCTGTCDSVVQSCPFTCTVASYGTWCTKG